MIKSQKKLLVFFLLSLLIKGLSYTNLYLTFWLPGDGITVFSVFLSLYMDHYVIKKSIDEDYSGNNLFLFFTPVFLAIVSQSNVVQPYMADLNALSLYFILISLGFLFFFLHQNVIIRQSARFHSVSRYIFLGSGYYAIAISFALFMLSLGVLTELFAASSPLQKYLLASLYVLPLVQGIALAIHFFQRLQEKRARRKLVVAHLGIWNIKGFIENAESIRNICARLDQGITVALFKIDNYSAFEGSMKPSDFDTFIRTFVNWLRFSLRKHDQLGMIDTNIFAVLLPFTDLEKGKIACVRLSQHTRKEIMAQNLPLAADFNMSFGLTVVNRTEENVVPAVKRAAAALARAEPGSVEEYTAAHISERQSDHHKTG